MNWHRGRAKRCHGCVQCVSVALFYFKGDFMAQYDGSIRINTKIDSKEASAQLMTLENRIVKTADKIASLRSKMDSLKDVKTPTQQYAALTAELDKQIEKLKEWNRYKQEQSEKGLLNENQIKSVNNRIAETENRIKNISKEMQRLDSAGQAFTFGTDTGEFAKLGQQLKYAENDMAVLNQRRQELQSKNAETESSYVRLGEAVRNSFSMIGKGLIDIPIAAVKKGAQGLFSVFSKLGNVVKTGVTSSFKKLGNVAKNAFSKITQHANKSGGALSKFGGRIKEIVMSFFIFNQIRKIFTSTVNSIKEGFTNLYNDNLKFKSSVDNLKASLLTMKNSLASAFTPIAETAIPYIQRLAEWVTKAADAVGQLLSALMGRKTYTRAIKQTAKASEEAAEAAEDETKAMNKQLSPLDKLNNLTSENAKEKEKDKEEGSGIGTMSEEVPISDKFKDIAKWLKDMWENSDFYELGKLLGEKLKSALDNIPWDAIKEVARKIGKSLATLINGFVEVEGLGYSIGKTLIEAINTGFEFLNAFVHNLHWDSVGKFIAETINGFFQNIDWDLIYDTFVTAAQGLSDLINNFVNTLDWDAIATSVSNFFNTLIDTLYIFITETDWIALAEKVGKAISDAFTGIGWAKAGQTVGEGFKAFFGFIATTIENIDWWSVGEKVKEFLVNIDWAGVAESFFEAIGAAFGGLAAFLGGLIAEAVVSAGEYFQGKIEECGGNVVLGILKGIGDALYDIGVWIKEHIFQPFIDGFKKAFEIHSPSKVMEGMGKYIIDGLLGGLKEKWKDVTTWITDKIQWLKEKLSGIAGSVKSAFTGGGGYSSRSNSSRMSTQSYSYVATPAYAALAEAPIPKLATGAVIPANKEFLAILGDQKRGTNVEAPLDTIKQAQKESLLEVLSELGLTGGGNNNSGGNNTYQFSVDGRVFFEIIQKYAEEFKKQSGGRPAFS